MEPTSKRVLWKGAISFGLVHIPIALHSATSTQGVDFDWLDRRTLDPVGYKRINKATGKEVGRDDIVKGIEYEDGQYVILSQEEIEAAYPKTTQTVEIEAFVSLDDIPFVYLDRPYYTSPIARGAKVYALLREVLRKTGKVGIAKVVIQTKQHLALLMPCGPALILNLLRWGDEVRSWEALELPPEGSAPNGLSAKEMAMGEQLVKDMSGKWNPAAFTDSFKEQILQLVREKVEAGETESVSTPQEQEPPAGAKILDLTEMLKRSLEKRGKPDTKTEPASNRKETEDDAGASVKRSRGAADKPAPKKAAEKAAKAPSGASRETGKAGKASKAAKPSAAKTASTPRKAAAKSAAAPPKRAAGRTKAA